jgi:hypothetical protein
MLTFSQQSSFPEVNFSTSPYMCEEMKSPTSSQRTVLFRSLWDQSLFGGLKAERKKKQKTLVGQPAFGNVAWSCSTQRQAQELISGPNLATRTRLLSFNRTKSRVVIGLLTGHNNLRRCLHVMGLSNNPICRKCGTEEEISVDVLFACETPTSLRHSYLGSLFLDLEDIRKRIIGEIWKFEERIGLH